MTQANVVKINKKAKKEYKKEVLQRGLFGVLGVVALAAGLMTGHYFFPAVKQASGLEPATTATTTDLPTRAEETERTETQTVATLMSTDVEPVGPEQEPVVDEPLEQASAVVEELAVPVSGRPAPEAILPSAVRVIVLNGSGVDGAAGRFAEYAEASGFVVVDTANAKQWDHEETEIYFAEENAEKARLVMELLGKTYSWIMYSEALDGRDADVVIVLGTTSPLQES